MKRIINIIFCSIFCVAIGLPILFFHNQDEKCVALENRTLSEMPALDQSILPITSDTTQSIESFISDHIGFRADFVNLANTVKVKVAGISSSDSVIIGKDGWLFYNPVGDDGDPLGEFTGTNDFSVEEEQEMLRFLESVQDMCDSNGAQFYLIICPDKYSIYGADYLPDCYASQAGETRTDRLVDYIRQNSDICCIYPKAEMLEMRDYAKLFYKTDTHWSGLGAYIAYREWYYEYTGEWLPALEDAKTVLQSRAGTDLLNMLAIRQKTDDYYRVDLGRGITYTNEHIDDSRMDLNAGSTNMNGLKALVFRDSFSNAILMYMLQDFQEATLLFRRVNLSDAELIQEQQPDVVIFEIVERYCDLIGS